MELEETLSGVPGMLRPFKQFIVGAGLGDGDQIVYYGCPGTCTPFIELLAFALRDLPFRQIFVPFIDETKARQLGPVPDVGMQAGEEGVEIDPAVVVVMGGLSMPNNPVSAGMVADTIGGYDAQVVGICFMNMFEKAGWTEEIAFDMIIDATIDPVSVWKNR
jgi:hypothetical protein